MRHTGIRNFIIYLFLAVFLVTGGGIGFDEGHQFPAARDGKSGSVITQQTLLTGEELHVFEVKEGSSAVFTRKGVQNNRFELQGRNCIALCILLILAGVFLCFREVYAYYDRLYVRDRYYMITFMQDTDGRKKFCSSR